MTNEQALILLGEYRRKFREKKIIPEPVPIGARLIPSYGSMSKMLNHAGETIGHTAWMVDGAIEYALAGDTDRVMRWLGFIQAILWNQGWYTVEELMGHVRGNLSVE
jgi:hypothetical protein